MDSKKVAYNLLIVAMILVALYFGQALIIPFVLALLFWYLLKSLRRLFGRINVKGKQAPWYLQLTAAASSLLTLSYFLGKLVASNFEEFVRVYPEYHDKILSFAEYISERYDLVWSVEEAVQELDLPNLMTEILNISSSLLSTVILVLIYVIFIIAEERIFPGKVKNIFSSAERLNSFQDVMSKIDESISIYLSTKTALCLLTAITSYVVLAIVGVDFAVLWAFLIFLLNFIPIIGAFVGIIFPTLIALIQFDGYVDAMVVVSLLTAIMVVIGNFVEPKVLGDKLNLSPLSVIVALSFWGALWGIAGMFLCIPITVILMIIFAQFPSLRPVAVLLSGGKVV